jgi:hypothetical protein
VRKHEGNYSLAVERIEQLEAELKNKDAVRLWNENEKLKEANRILRDALESIIKYEYTDGHMKDAVGATLEQADKIMEGGEG